MIGNRKGEFGSSFVLRFEAQNVLEYFSCSFRENPTSFESITAPMVIFEIKTILDDQNRKKKD